ncbi:hypothetical protein ACBY01_11790 [Sphingomonas sp. ac-8]|uniref:hypothetical protein n=1 Tax=Sphingomonas sp. ac-8 TaxID=3242977 RepID=UPI003A7FE315
MMATTFTIDRGTGIIRIGTVAALEAGQRRSAIEPGMTDWLTGFRDHGNGYAWLDLGDLTFGGQPASLALCFHEDRLEQASWSVRLSGVKPDWLGRAAIDAELAFVHATLGRDMGITVGPTDWGEVWSCFDAKGGMASNGLRYSRA